MKVMFCSLATLAYVKGIGPEVSPVKAKLGVERLIKSMELEGFPKEDIDFIDIEAISPDDQEIEQYFRDSMPDIFALSAVTATTFTEVLRISKIAKKVTPEAWIVLGGNSSTSSHIMLKKTDVDLVVVGDGEFPFNAFVEYVKQNGRKWAYEELSQIEGISFLSPEGEVRFTNFAPKYDPQPPYENFEILKRGLKNNPELQTKLFHPVSENLFFKYDPRVKDSNRPENVATMNASKGCVAACTFCQRSTKGYRAFSLDPLEDHIIHLKREYNVGYLDIADENFGTDKKRTYEMARIFKKHDIMWCATGVRVTGMNYEDLKFYKEHGCTALKFGIESGSQKILDIMEKNLLVEKTIRCIEWTIELGLLSPLALMVGMPGETEDTVKETGKFLGTLAHKIGVHPLDIDNSVFYALPFPGTPLYEYGQQIGVLGTTIEEEAQYLEEISNAYTGKFSYVNLNGAPVSEVLFWDHLLWLEASRMYHKLSLVSRNNTPQKELIENISNDPLWAKKPVKRNYNVVEFIKNLKNFHLGLFVTHYIVENKFFYYNPLGLRIPKLILYPLLKYLLYFEFQIKKILISIFFPEKLKNKIWYTKKFLGNGIRITDAQLTSKRRIERSLRYFVRQNRLKLPQPVTETEKSIELFADPARRPGYGVDVNVAEVMT